MLKAVTNQKGVSLVLLALSIVVLFGFGALAIDIGHLYHVKNELQVAADAAALAGAARLDGTQDPTQTAARDEAQRMAALNFADVAYAAVPGFGRSPGAPNGGQVPVALRPSQADGDIIVGFWDGTAFTPADGSHAINAVEVNARRLGDIAAQPRPNNWFARVFKLLNVDYSFTGVSAVAIAARQSNLPFVPIAVNEYWDEASFNTRTGTYPAGDPYGQQYPQSFMREHNAGVVPGVPDIARGGQTFAIVGTRANSNNSAFDLNSFVDVLHRNSRHTPLKNNWFLVKEDSTTGSCSPSCDNNLSPLTSVTSGDVNPGKWDENFAFLFNGIPDNVIPPNAVREVIRGIPAYTGDNYSPANGNDPSKCPYASVAYFQSSGAGTIIKKFSSNDALNGMRFYEKYPKGSRLIVMVYDGSYVPNPDPSQANVVTVIGYGIIEIDGYLDGPFNGDVSRLNPGGTGKGGGTAYGHAVPHGIPGADDKYLIQPSDADRAPDCSFIDKLRQLQTSGAAAGGSVRLVDPNLRYGLANH